MLAINKKATNWILIGISFQNFKPFNTNFDCLVSNLTNGRVILKFKNYFIGNFFFHCIVPLF